MPSEKLSISLDAELATTIRSAAASDGVSVSSWIASAAEQRTRRQFLREALDAFDAEFGPLQPGEADLLIAQARASSIVSQPSASQPLNAA